MKTVTHIPSTLRQGIIISIIFHLLLGMVFLFVKIPFAPLPMPVAEVSFISGAPGIAGIGPATANLRQQPRTEPVDQRAAQSPAIVKSPLRPPQPKLKKQSPSSTPVTPPKRTMTEMEEPQLTARQAKKQQGAENIGSDTAASHEPSAAAAPSSGEDGSAQTGGTSRTDDRSGDSGQPYTIEGEAAQRIIIHQVIPTYPEGLQREAVIKYRFWVQPDGRITGIIPMRKGDAVLERITIEALSQWRFNPLPASAEQKVVQGLITFRYELR